MPRSDEHHDERYEDGDVVESPYPDWDAYWNEIARHWYRDLVTFWPIDGL